MDPQHAKRPRSSTPSKGGSDVRKKKKKARKAKLDGATNDGDTAAATMQGKLSHIHRDRTHHHKETATPEGSIMAQVLTTFSSLEQSRFRAFKRSAFNADAVEAWVAACLQDRYSEILSNACTNQTSSRKLEDLVAPNQAQDIGLVVALAAKIYCQRLISEAVVVHQKERSSTISSTASTAATATTPLPPTAVYRAVQARRRRGVDPGFFMQPATDCFNWEAVTASFDIRRLAAEHAQSEYDKLFSSPELLPKEAATASNGTDGNVDMKRTHEPQDGA